MELKPGYKQTEVGVIPEDWDCVHIGEVAETSSGATPPRAKQQEYFDGGSIPWVKTLDLNNSLILETDERVTPSALQQTSLRLYPAGSVLVAMYGGFNQIGRTGMLTKDATINQALTAIRPDQSRLSSRFLLNYLNFRVEYWKSVASSSRKDPNITGRDVREFPIPLPPLREQAAAGEALQDIEDQILILDELIDKKTDIKQAAMQELLTGKHRLPGFEGEWEVKRLGDVLSICHGKNQRDVEVADGPYPILATGGQIGTAARPLHSKPSVLIGRKGTINKPQYMDTPFWTVDTLFYSAMKEENCARFFYYLFCTIDWMQFNEASGVPSLNAKTIESIEVGCPDTQEQDAIASVLSELDAELEALETRKDKAQMLKQGMMQQLLSGKIRLK